ncbi:glycosyltransferase family 2 protein [Aliiroseovarius sp. Z3]|uniref:glycosyltransferase family 2 protein n=1 Tax=Aliiroseovarius sp. Z3 TaxID=2811402 RepID=UPI0023B20F6D|nr:glycosyltransferase family 2 protein [Aliiroseovarius sp. Z3]MDE9451622.1 glycosyltransferase family 2 protein [Aliiroseovarius sp. Z3]
MTIGREKVLLLSVMRNEGPYILEWLAHHFSLGIDDLLIFTNGCTDNTDKILDRLEALMPHRVKHQPNPKVMFPDRGKWHIMALRYAGHFGRCKAADWLYVTDADEFLNLRGDLETLDQFFDATGPADAVSFTSVAFNSNGHRTASTDLVTRRFTQTSSQFEAAAAQNTPVITAVKTLYRNTVQGPRRPHRPVTNAFSQTGQKWINGSGVEMLPEFTDGAGKAINALGSRDHAQVNHYAIKSAAEFLLKVDRGDAVHADRLGASEQYWTHGNRPGDIDTSGAKQSADAKAMLDDFLADTQLRELHEESFALRETRLAEILKTEAGENLARAIGFYD